MVGDCALLHQTSPPHFATPPRAVPSLDGTGVQHRYPDRCNWCTRHSLPMHGSARARARVCCVRVFRVCVSIQYIAEIGAMLMA